MEAAAKGIDPVNVSWASIGVSPWDLPVGRLYHVAVIDGVGPADRNAEAVEQLSEVIKLAFGIVNDHRMHWPAAELALLTVWRKVRAEGEFKADVEGPPSRPDDDLF